MIVKRSEFYTLGRTGLRASRLALGAMTFGTDWGWGTDKEGARQLFNHYVEAGGNLVDTADLYTSGVSEEWVGEFIRERQLRDRIVLATKFSYSAQPDNPNAGGNGRKNILRAVEGSLRRLGTDYIDLYLLHTWDMLTPVDEVMRIFDDLVRSPEGGLSIDWWRRRECSRCACCASLGLRCAQARRPTAGVVASLCAMLVEPGTRVLFRTVSIKAKATRWVAFAFIGGGGGN